MSVDAKEAQDVKSSPVDKCDSPTFAESAAVPVTWATQFRSLVTYKHSVLAGTLHNCSSSPRVLW